MSELVGRVIGTSGAEVCSKRRIAAVAVAVVAAVILSISAWLWHQFTAQRRDRDMVASIRSTNYQHVLYLLQSGADPNAREVERSREPLLRRILDLVRREPDGGAVGLPAMEVFFTPEKEWNGGLTHGRMAAKRLELLRALVERGANVQARDDTYLYGEGVPVAAYPATWGYIDGLHLLLDHGADVNAATNQGESLLMFAVDPYSKRFPWQAAAVRLLLDRGADPHHKNTNGDTALSYAEDVNDQQIIRMLKQHW